MREALESDSPVTYTDGTERPITTAKMFGVQIANVYAIFPKLGEPWVFGMHQCSHPRIWTEEEKKLLKEIGRRISDGLSSALYLRELQQNEERFRATFEQAAVGIAHVSPDGRWIRVNRKLCDIVGYNKEELLKKTFQEIIYHEDLDADLDHFRRMLAGEIQTYSVEMRYIHKNGSIIWTNLTVSMVRYTLDDPAYFISVIEDISERQAGRSGENQTRRPASASAKIGGDWSAGRWCGTRLQQHAQCDPWAFGAGHAANRPGPATF